MAAAKTLRVRMYRPGFGDCFLLTFYSGRKEHHILIDCGVWHGADIGTMAAIVADIQKCSKGNLAVVVASHAHQDHVSGFIQYAGIFSKMKIGQVWLPWTENPSDKTAANLRTRRVSAIAEVRRGLRLSGQKSLGAAADFALSNALDMNDDLVGLTKGFGDKSKVQFWSAGGRVAEVPGIDGLSVEFLGPPTDVDLLGRMNPPKTQRYLAEDADSDPTPFKPFAGSRDFTESCPLQQAPPTDYLSKLNQAAGSVPAALALQLDNILNNTSLVMLLRYRGKSLLFPGDAQYGNWSGWMNGKDAEHILGNLDFLKLSHHASANATPRRVVECLAKGKTVVVVPTQENVYNEIPRSPLLEAMADKCAIVRSDQIIVRGAPSGPRTKLPRGFSRGSVWIDYVI